MAAYLFHGGKFLDPRKTELQDGIEVLIEDDRIKEVSDRPSPPRAQPGSTCAGGR